MKSAILAAACALVFSGSSYADVYRVDAIDPLISSGDWHVNEPFPTSLNISFLLNTRNSSFSSSPGCGPAPSECLGKFSSSLSAWILDVSTPNIVFARNEKAAGGFLGDTLVSNCGACTFQSMAEGMGVNGQNADISIQFDSLHGVSYSQVLSSKDPTSLLLLTLKTHLPILHVSSAQGDFWASASNLQITSVPEPSTYAMMSAGLLMIGFMARRWSE